MNNPLKILIVDNDISLQEVFSDYLRSEGYDVTCVSSGFEALQQLKSIPFDIVFLDTLMPEMNGVETFQRIKSNGFDTTVVMMTAYAYSELIDQAKNLGAQLILLKPFDFNQIIRFLKEFAASNGLNSETVGRLRQALDYRTA
ncbi:MAG: response regulator [candidate division WOR-3 bacterium]